MKYEEFRNYLDKASLSNKDFAELVGMSAKSISNLKGRDRIPNHLIVIATLMSLLNEHNIEFKSNLMEHGVKKLRPRGKVFMRKEEI